MNQESGNSSSHHPRSGNRRDLVNAPIPSTLLIFALPTLLSSVLQSLNGSINTAWIGHLIGETAVAATTNGNLVMFLLISFVFGFGMASTILIGQAVGRRNIHEARRVLGTAVGFFLPAVIGIAIVGWLLAPALLDLLDTAADVQPLALAYLRTIFIAVPPMLMATLLMMALRGTGDSLTPLWFMGIICVLDSGLNPLFILGLGPLPTLGIVGSGVATVLANLIGLGAMLGYIYWRNLPLRLRGEELAFLKPDLAYLKIIVLKGIPMGLQMVVVTTSALAMLSLVNRQGVNTTAAYGATQQLWTYVQMPAMALGAAVSAMAAQSIGAGRWDRLSDITRAGIMFNLLLTGALVTLLLLFDRSALALFLGYDSPAVAIGRHIQVIATWGFLAFGVSFVLFGTVRANGEVLRPLLIMFIAMYPVRLGIAWGLKPWLGVDALWWSFPASMVATMLMAILLYKRGKWRRRHVMAPDPQALREDECQHQCASAREPCGSMRPTG
nr:MATE family efflux transporter [uncultured Halomonas sp.]